MGATLLASPVLGASILGGSALVGTAATALTNKSNQNFGAEQSEKSRAWSTNERLAAQAYNTSERLAAQDYNTSERLATQAYNDPRNQMKMMRSAGLNPSVLGQAVSFVGSQPQSSHPQSSSPGPSSTPSIGTAQVPNIPQLISSGSDLVNALSKSRETQASLPLINQQVEYYLKKTYGEQLTNDLMQLEKQLKQSTLPADIKRQFEEVAKLQFEKVVMQNLGKKYENEATLAKAQESLAKATEKLTGEQAIQAQFLTSHQQQSFDSMLRLQNAQSNQANAQARESSVSADQTQLFNKLYSDKRYQYSLVTQAVEAGRQAVEQSKISKSQADHMKYLVEQAAYANDMKEFTYWSSQVNQFVNTLGSAASQFYGAGALRELINIRKRQQLPPKPVRGFTP